jgi:hypothetical protein
MKLVFVASPLSTKEKVHRLHIINLKKKKNHGHRGPGFFLDKKLILDYYFSS